MRYIAAVLYIFIITFFLNINIVIHKDSDYLGDLYIVGNVFKRCIKFNPKEKVTQSCYSTINKDKVIVDYINSML